jgi:hypothetical protein
VLAIDLPLKFLRGRGKRQVWLVYITAVFAKRFGLEETPFRQSDI